MDTGGLPLRFCPPIMILNGSVPWFQNLEYIFLDFYAHQSSKRSGEENQQEGKGSHWINAWIQKLWHQGVQPLDAILACLTFSYVESLWRLWTWCCLKLTSKGYQSLILCVGCNGSPQALLEFAEPGLWLSQGTVSLYATNQVCKSTWLCYECMQGWFGIGKSMRERVNSEASVFTVKLDFSNL